MHVSCTAATSREIAKRLSERDIGFLDAPVSGGVAGAVAGKLTVMVGGDGALLDELLDGFGAAAQAGRWQPDAAGEARRRALLPPSPALAWDALVASPAYGRALSQLPA